MYIQCMVCIADTIHVFTFYFKGAVVVLIAEVYSIQHYEIKFASSSCLFFVASFSGVSIFDCPFHVIKRLCAADRLFPLGTPVSSNKTTDRHNITEILLKVTLNTIIPYHSGNKQSIPVYLDQLLQL